jgi:hypothetical protein
LEHPTKQAAKLLFGGPLVVSLWRLNNYVDFRPANAPKPLHHEKKPDKNGALLMGPVFGLNLE